PSRYTPNPTPELLHPKPETLYPKPQTPKPHTQPQTHPPNPKPPQPGSTTHSRDFRLSRLLSTRRPQAPSPRCVSGSLNVFVPSNY
ncbi:hypothetical protein T484DRAFT_1610334, partial [Baffinella frigidus]